MKVFLPIAAIAMMVTSAGATRYENAEAAFVACLAEKEPALIAKIRDADSEAAFTDALKKASEVCDAKLDGISMGKLFRALNAHKTTTNGATD